MTLVDVEIAMALPTPNQHEHHFTRAGRVKKQREATRKGLDEMALVRPSPPCEVTLYRVSRGSPDSDRSALALAAVRDEVARWLYNVPASVYDAKKGKDVTPRAPDGPGDGIRWAYGMIKTNRVGYQAARIIITK
jgi:hypothetical protein